MSQDNPETNEEIQRTLHTDKQELSLSEQEFTLYTNIVNRINSALTTDNPLHRGLLRETNLAHTKLNAIIQTLDRRTDYKNKHNW